MNTMFINSENGKTSNRTSVKHQHLNILLNITDKIDLRRKDKYIALSSFSTHYTWKI